VGSKLAVGEAIPHRSTQYETVSLLKFIEWRWASRR
jgi:hypothetical protein